jgi:hypothetical protein
MRIGGRVPFGIEHVFISIPIGLFMEVIPTFDVAGAPDSREFFGLQGSVGFRYCFGGPTQN